MWALSPAVIAATISSRPAVSYPVGTAPRAVTSGDFNGDGKLDLAVANSGNPSAGDSGGISILLGNGDGTFQTARNLSAGKNPTCVAVSDFNGDGRLDLVVTNSDGTGSLATLLGNGDGTFQPLVEYASASAPMWAVVSDFDHDNRPDVAVLNIGAPQISVFLGNGDGTLQNHVDYSGAFPGSALAIGDFNGDGNTDLVFGMSVLPSSLLLGNGDGTFQSPIVIAVNGGSFFAVADFNADGNVDLVDPSCGIFTGKCVENLRLGNGDGTFQSPVKLANGAASVAAADFDGDGKLDLVLNGLALFSGNGDGTFQAPVNFPITAGGLLFTTDLNVDKAPDLVVADSTNNIVAVVLNVGTDFSLSASPASPATIRLGQTATSTLNLSLLTAFDNPVSLSCAVQPAQVGAPSCSVNPSSVSFDGSGKATAQMIITAGASAASLTQHSVPQDRRPWHSRWLPIAGFAFVGAGLARSGAGRRRFSGFLVGSFLFAGLILQLACGGSGSSSGPKSQTYTIRVTALSVSAQRTTTVTLTVQ